MKIVKLAQLSIELKRLAALDHQATIIGIDGLGGAGKSSFAERLSGFLGDVPVVHSDDFASANDPLWGWAQRMIDQVLKPLSSGQDAHYQRYDWSTKCLANWVTVRQQKIILLEGVGVTRKTFLPYLAYKIWIECPAVIRLERGLARDGQEAKKQWLEWMKEEDQYVGSEDPMSAADLVVMTAAEVHYNQQDEFVQLNTSKDKEQRGGYSLNVG